MTTYYCDPQLTTGNDDGTTVANAWQTLNKVLDGTVVSGTAPVAGDTVLIRAATSGGDIQLTWGTSQFPCYVQGGTVAAPITYTVDSAGDTAGWEAGTLEINVTTGTDNSNNLAFNEANVVFGANSAHGLKIRANKPSAHFRRCVWVKDVTNIKLHDIYFTAETNGNYIVGCVAIDADYVAVVVERCKMRQERAYSTSILYSAVPVVANGGTVCFIDLIILDPDTDTTDRGFIGLNGYGSTVSVLGGDGSDVSYSTNSLFSLISGSGSAASNFVTAKNFNFGVMSPRQINDTADWDSTNRLAGVSAKFINNYGDTSFAIFNNDMHCEWKETGNYPDPPNSVRQGDSSWSLRCLPTGVTTSVVPSKVWDITKTVTDSDAARTVVVELAIKKTNDVGGSGAYDNLTNDDFFMIVSYLGADGTQYVEQTTRDTSSLATSSSTWSPESGGYVTYGADSYVKHKLTLTTANSVEQYSDMLIDVFCCRPAGVASDYFFVDPDPNIT